MVKKINSFIVSTVSSGEVVFDIEGEMVTIVTEDRQISMLVEDLITVAEGMRILTNPVKASR
jgi:hypothetical protein